MHSPAELLVSWLRRQLPSPAFAWLEQTIGQLREANSDRTLYLALASAARRLGKEGLTLQPADIAEAETARHGWRSQYWNIDTSARVLLLLAGNVSPERFAARLDMVCKTAEVGELIAYYRGLPLYPNPVELVTLAADGVRTNIADVFSAIAHHNPYPAEFFNDAQWNQMVLKALFIGAPLHPIERLDARANPELARMLIDYARERTAAHRTVSPELWRCVGPFLDPTTLGDVVPRLASDDIWERRAAALALGDSPHPDAAILLQTAPALIAELKTGTLSWDTFAPPLR
jgi:hypothetical protein